MEAKLKSHLQKAEEDGRAFWGQELGGILTAPRSHTPASQPHTLHLVSQIPAQPAAASSQRQRNRGLQPRSSLRAGKGLL